MVRAFFGHFVDFVWFWWKYGYWDFRETEFESVAKIGLGPFLGAPSTPAPNLGIIQKKVGRISPPAASLSFFWTNFMKGLGIFGKILKQLKFAKNAFFLPFYRILFDLVKMVWEGVFEVAKFESVLKIELGPFLEALGFRPSGAGALGSIGYFLAVLPNTNKQKNCLPLIRIVIFFNYRAGMLRFLSRDQTELFHWLPIGFIILHIAQLLLRILFSFVPFPKRS